jgi:HSP20 family protein
VERYAMAKPMKTEKKTELAPFRPNLPGIAGSLMERMDEMLSERWGWWPALRWHDEVTRVPPIDVYEEEGAVVVKSELPGMKKEEVEVTLEGRLLTIAGRKEREEKVERKSYVRYERHSGAFSRTIPLPAEVKADEVTATLKDGVLVVRAPRAEVGKPSSRKVEIG